MRVSGMVFALLLGTTVAWNVTAGDSKPRSFRSTCMSFEILALEDQVVVRRVKGRAVVGEGADFEPLQDVQIAVRNLDTGVVKFRFTNRSGRFVLPWLPAGRYRLWTCLDGFDQIEIEVRIDHSAPARELRIFVPVSEGGGWGQVDLLEKP